MTESASERPTSERHNEPVEPQIDNHPDEAHGQPLEAFQREGMEEADLEGVGEGETQDGPV
jgi:hypothetical protein